VGLLEVLVEELVELGKQVNPVVAGHSDKGLVVVGHSDEGLVVAGHAVELQKQRRELEREIEWETQSQMQNEQKHFGQQQLN
jgi:hypothetical protein